MQDIQDENADMQAKNPLRTPESADMQDMRMSEGGVVKNLGGGVGHAACLHVRFTKYQ